MKHGGGITRASMGDRGDRRSANVRSAISPRLPWSKGPEVSTAAKVVAEIEAAEMGKPVSSNPLHRGFAVIPADVERKMQYGRFAVGDRVLSARLNPELAAAASTIDAVIDSDEGQQELGKLVQSLQTGGGKKRQRGGEVDDILTLYGFTELPSVQEKAAYLKAIAMMAIYNGSEAAKAGWTGSADMRAASAAYFKENYAPLYTTGGRLAGIIGGLADQLIVKAPVTTAMLVAGGAGYTVNFFKWVFTKYNEVGRATAADLLSDDRAKNAAEAAVGSTVEALQTTAVAAFVANQLGLLPLSAVLAAILWQIRASLAPGGRAYLVAGFYAWYKAQPPATKTAIKAAAKKYAADAQSAATRGAPAVKAAAGGAAAALGGLLAGGAGAAGSAFDAVAAAVRRAAAGEGRVEDEQVAAANADGGAALVGGAPAAAIAAGQVGAGAAVAAARGGRRRSKTKKTKSKRQVTRRRKVQKVLGAPVFIY